MITVKHLCPDIWQEIFQYFNATELVFSFAGVTQSTDEVLFGADYRSQRWKLILDAETIKIPAVLSLERILSIELHENGRFELINKCSNLRCLKIVGEYEWIITVIQTISYEKLPLYKLILVIPGPGLLYDLLIHLACMTYLIRLEIYAEQREERIKKSISSAVRLRIQQFILHSCSSITLKNLSDMSSMVSDIGFLDLTLSHRIDESFRLCTFPNLLSIRLTLIDVPFEYLTKLLDYTPSLLKMKLYGIVESAGFVINHEWYKLFKPKCPLNTVVVNLSLEQDAYLFRDQLVQIAMHKCDLNLKCLDDDSDTFIGSYQPRSWWTLSGIITKNRLC